MSARPRSAPPRARRADAAGAGGGGALLLGPVPHAGVGAASKPRPVAEGRVAEGGGQQEVQPSGGGGGLGLLDEIFEEALLLVGSDQLAGRDQVLVLDHAPGPAGEAP